MEYPKKLYLLERYTPLTLFMEKGDLIEYLEDIALWIPERDCCCSDEDAIARVVKSLHKAKLIDKDEGIYKLSNGCFVALEEINMYWQYRDDLDCDWYGSEESIREELAEK